jgi:hypothetical protein
MATSLPAYKRKALEDRKSKLVEEYEVVSQQLNSSLEAGQSLRLQRQLDRLEREIAEVDAKLAGTSSSRPTSQPHERMQGIPSELSTPLRETLLQCAELSNPQMLQAVFAHESLTPWRYSVPTVGMPRAQVNTIIAQLADHYRTDGQNALIFFLEVLAENYDESHQLHHDLLDLAAQLATYK